MKQVLIIIRPNMYYKTKQALLEERFFAITTREIFGRGKAPVQYDAAEGGSDMPEGLYENSMTLKRMLEIYVRDEDLSRLVDTVCRVNRTGNAGDGKIFILPLESSLRIHTGERGDDSLV